MLQNAHKTLGFKKNMVFEIPPGGKSTISSQWPTGSVNKTSRNSESVTDN